MQIGIDLGATKIEYVLLDNKNKEIKRNRLSTPENYENTILTLVDIVKKLDQNDEKFNIGICHPGAVDKTTGLIKNAHNSQWLNNKNLIKDLKKTINNNILTENDANCFCLSEAFDGSASHYESVFGIILGSGCGGGLVINKKIISGANGLGGEWSLNQMPIENIKSLKSNKVLDFSNRIEGYLSGKSIEKRFYEKYKNKISAREIFSLYRDKDKDARLFVDYYKEILSRSLIIIITSIDPDAIVFGGGISSEIDFLDEIKNKASEYINEPNLKTVFLKPKYGDASGVRGAAILSRQNSI
tara:strand:+ start:156 stop:1055 length:900 start_codon:yes stop_codon:yes gene_type:complete